MVCKECDREFETLDSLRRHRVQKHKIPIYPIQLKTVANDIRKNRIAQVNNATFLGKRY